MIDQKISIRRVGVAVTFSNILYQSEISVYNRVWHILSARYKVLPRSDSVTTNSLDIPEVKISYHSIGSVARLETYTVTGAHLSVLE